MTTLHFIAGKAGAGKTTLARELGQVVPALVICEDEWMERLAPPIETLDQYLQAAARIRRVIRPLTIDLLRLGTSVVFDFAANTPRDRAWVRSIFEEAKAEHKLHYLSVDDATCARRVKQRNETRPEGLFFGVVNEAQIAEVNRYFVPPDPEEAFEIVSYPSP